MQLELTQEEQGLLLNLLEENYHELRAEICKTENHEYKVTLKSKEHLMEGLLQKLSCKTYAKAV